MAIYHLHVKVIGRATGASAVAAAAYRSASRLRDRRLERSHDFTAKHGVVHSEVFLPDGAPEVWSDRERLWNAVEATELRRDAQLAREVEFALPRELSRAEGIALARDFVEAEFVAHGMIADLNVHWDRAEVGMPKPHAHVMLTMRSVEGDGFEPKVRDWNRTEMVTRWRQRWAELANQRLAELDIDVRIDHRSLEAQGLALEPQSQVGAPALRIEGEGAERTNRAELHRMIARRNGERICADPSVGLAAIVHQQSTFTRCDMARFAHRHSDGTEQFNRVMDAMRSAPDLVQLGADRRGEQRFTTRGMIAAERRLMRAADLMAGERRRDLGKPHWKAASARAAERGLILFGEQVRALTQITGGRDLEIVIGPAGTGKSALLGVAREAWEAAGYRVRGAALSGIAAEGLETGSGIASRTLASLEHGWIHKLDLLTEHDVLVIDEAGMVGTRQLERVLSHAAEARTRVVLIGDPQQLQAIEAGAAFRALHDRHGGARLGEVRRQREDWQRAATQELAMGHVGAALQDYDTHGRVHQAETRQEARAELIDRWDSDRHADPGASRIILTHTNDEVRLLNEAARARLWAAGELGDDIELSVERGSRSFAAGDRVMFLRNERSLGVKNGTLGIVAAVNAREMSVRTDVGRSVRFELKDYAHLDHGYAATIHKAQGLTVDRAHVLATPGLDSHSAYVALSRHRDGMDFHYGLDDFATKARLVSLLSRDRSKDMALDHADPVQDYAERRGITICDKAVDLVKNLVPERLRERIGDLAERLRAPGGDAPGLEVGQRPGRGEGGPGPRRDQAAPPAEIAEDRGAALRTARTRALVRHAREAASVIDIQLAGGKPSAAQWRNLREARAAFQKLHPDGWRDAEQAYLKEPELARRAARGRIRGALQALRLETEIRTGPQRRADAFVTRWQTLHRTSKRRYGEGPYAAYEATRSAMRDMTMELARDPQMESLLANRKRALGIDPGLDSGRRLGHELAFQHGLELDRSRRLSL